jgi:hypothetical protein
MVTTTSAEPTFKLTTLDDYGVLERSFVLQERRHPEATLAFTVAEELDGPLNKVRGRLLRNPGKPPMFYVLVALGVDGESTDEVWVTREGAQALEAVQQVIELLPPIRDRLSAIDRANRGVPPRAAAEAHS